MNNNTPEFWKKLKPDSIVTLTDKETLRRGMESGAGMDGTDYTISRIIDVPQQEKICRWMFFELECGEDTRWLWVKIVDNEIDLHVMEMPEAFNRGDRYDFAVERVDSEDDYRWVFQNPEECDDDPECPVFDEDGALILDNLRYTTEIDWEGQAYVKKKQGDLCGIARERPEPTGELGPQLATIAEYHAINDNDKPDNAVFLEIGPEEDERGGMISLMIGWRVATTEVNVLNR